MSFIFDSTKEYTLKEIKDICYDVKQADDNEAVFADTVEREYVFMKSGKKWKLSHTWFHGLLTEYPKG